jgi:hypothetical protein
VKARTTTGNWAALERSYREEENYGAILAKEAANGGRRGGEVTRGRTLDELIMVGLCMLNRVDP